MLQILCEEVMDLQYGNLQELMRGSSSTREYFLSLLVETQIELHKQNDLIHSASQLHIWAGLVEKRRRAIELSESFDRFF